MSKGITGTTSSDSKTLVPPINGSEYKKVGLQRIEFSYPKKPIIKIVKDVNDDLYFKKQASAPHPEFITIPAGYYGSVGIVARLNREQINSGSFYIPRTSKGGIPFSVDSDDKIKMQVFGLYVVLFDYDNSISDTIGFNSKLQGTTSNSKNKSFYRVGLYKAWNNLRDGERFISVDCDLVNPFMNFIENKDVNQSSSLFVINNNDLVPGQIVDIHLKNVLFLPTRTDWISNFKISLSDQDGNHVDFISDIIVTIEISK